MAECGTPITPPSLSTAFWLLDLGYLWGGFGAGSNGQPVYQFRALREGDGDGGDREAGNDAIANFDTVSNMRCRSPRRDQDRRLLCPFRLSGRMLPTAFLCTCRQVYREARCVPLCSSEFVFVRRISSGLSTAHAFVVLGSSYSDDGKLCRLQPWQRDSMQYVRLELDVTAADIGWEWPDDQEGNDGSSSSSSSRHTDEQAPTSASMLRESWTALCRCWAQGLRGLRLTLVVAPSSDGRRRQHQRSPAVADSPLAEGLRLLQMLRQLEVELAVPGGERVGKAPLPSLVCGFGKGPRPEDKRQPGRGRLCAKGRRR